MKSNSEKVLMKNYDYRYMLAASMLIYVFFMTVHYAVKCFVSTPQTATFGEFICWIPVLGLAIWNAQQNVRFFKKQLNKNESRPIQRDYEWVRDIIETCFDESHFEIALNVIGQFDKKYNDKVYLDWLMSYWKRRKKDIDYYLLKQQKEKEADLRKEKVKELSDAEKN